MLSLIGGLELREAEEVWNVTAAQREDADRDGGEHGGRHGDAAERNELAKTDSGEQHPREEQSEERCNGGSQDEPDGARRDRRCAEAWAVAPQHDPHQAEQEDAAGKRGEVVVAEERWLPVPRRPRVEDAGAEEL